MINSIQSDLPYSPLISSERIIKSLSFIREASYEYFLFKKSIEERYFHSLESYPQIPITDRTTSRRFVYPAGTVILSKEEYPLTYIDSENKIKLITKIHIPSVSYVDFFLKNIEGKVVFVDNVCLLLKLYYYIYTARTYADTMDLIITGTRI